MTPAARRESRMFVPVVRSAPPAGSAPGPASRRLGRGTLAVTLMLVGVLLFVLAGCATPRALSEGPQVPSTITINAVFPDLPAAAGVEAVRVDPPATIGTVVPFDAVAYVNGLDYGWKDIAPAMEAYRVVALSRGWSPSTIEVWAPFVADVIDKESGGCPNVQGGDVFQVGSCTELVVDGHAEDSGFGQVTTALYGRTGVLCEMEGLCSQAQIIGSPWVSMLALVATLEYLGRYPWCDYQGAPAYHDCGLIPKGARP